MWRTDEAFRIICLERHSDFSGVINFSLRRNSQEFAKSNLNPVNSIVYAKKLPRKKWTELFYLITNLKTRLNRTYFSRYWSSRFCPKLRKGIWHKFSGLTCEQTIDSEAFRVILLQRHNKFCGVISLSWRHKQTVYLGKLLWTQFVCVTKNHEK